MSRPLNETLLRAYRHTSFFVDTHRGRLTIRVDTLNAGLEQFLVDLGVQSWAFVTAFNSSPEALSDDENRRRHASLEKRVRELGLQAFPGEGVGDDGAWPPERSLFIPGISREAAIALGREF